MLQFFTGSDYDLLLRRVPAEKVHAHRVSDRLFLEDWVTRCQNAGLAMRVPPDEISGLLYPLALASLHADDLRQNNFGGSLHVLLELVAAFCLGEVTVTPQELDRAAPGTDAGSRT
jgi:hypothetical protein